MNEHNEQQALPCPFCGREPDLSFNSVSCGCAASPFIDREDALQVWNTRAAQPSPVVKQNLTTQPAASQEAVAWFTDDHLTDRSATTYDAAVAERWRAKGWPVIPLYAAPVTAAPADAEEDAYVIEQTTKLLAEIAVIVNGPEPAGTRWSYHDLPAKVRALASIPAAPEPSYLEYLDLQNHSLRRAIHAMMAKLVFLLDEDQFADIEAIALAAGVTPAAPGIDLAALRARVVSAVERITSGAASMRIPADMTDPDLVLGDVLCLLDSLGPQTDASAKGALNEQFGSAEGLGSSEARDAARYRWLRDVGGTTWNQPWVAVGYYEREWDKQPNEVVGKQLDDAIDAAMQAQSLAGDAEVQP